MSKNEDPTMTKEARLRKEMWSRKPKVKDERTVSLFHQAWGEAHDSPDYQKETWRQLRQALFEIGVEI